MKGKIKYFIKNSKGASTVEFALTIGIFLAVVLSIFEFARMSILSAYMDLTITHAVRLTKNDESIQTEKGHEYQYELRFKENLDKVVEGIKNQNKDFKFLDMNDQDIISFDVKYSKVGTTNFLQDFIDGSYKDTVDPNDPTKKIPNPGQGSVLAKYSFQYKYKPMFFWMPSAISDPVFNRQIVISQEYEK